MNKTKEKCKDLLYRRRKPFEAESYGSQKTPRGCKGSSSDKKQQLRLYSVEYTSPYFEVRVTSRIVRRSDNSLLCLQSQPEIEIKEAFEEERITSV